VTPIEQLYAAYHARDPLAAAAVYLHDGWHREVASGRESRGRQAIARALGEFLTAFPDAYWHVEHRIADVAHEALAYRLTGTLMAPLGRLQPRGQRLDLRGVHIIEIRDGAIACCEDYWDALSFQRQMAAVGEGPS
jgi:steroid delta-isomerase-like uncharacterized protein